MQRLPWMVLAAVVGLAILTGCDEQTVIRAQDSTLTAQTGMSLGQVAQRLNMRVDEESSVMGCLKGGGNIVIVYPDPGGQVYVNGRPISNDPGIELIGGSIYLPTSAYRQIRASLRMGGDDNIAKPPVKVADTTVIKKPPVKDTALARVSGKVVIDAGHGAHDPGTTGVNGVKEKGINLAVARDVAARLRSAGVDVVMTRNDDTFLTLEDRAAAAAKAGASLFVSIHSDSAGNASAQGFTVYVSRSPSAASLSAARSVERSLSGVATSRGVKEAGYVVIATNAKPAILVELGFLSNAAEAARLSSADYQQRLGNAIAEGVAEYLKSH